MFENPHAAFDGRSSEILSPGHGEKTSFAKQPAAVIEFRPERHAAEMGPVDIRNAVMPGESLIDEGIVRGEQIDDIAILPHDTFKEQLRLTPERLAQLVVPVGIENSIR